MEEIKSSRKNLKILWHSNSPVTPTGYGNQTKLFTPRINAVAGYDVTISANWGRQASAAINQWGILELPSGADLFGNDVIGGHVNAIDPDVVFSLYDARAFDPNVWGQFNWAAWIPVDCTPMLPADVAALQASRWQISMSMFGDRQLRDAGFYPLYVPHGVDTNTYKPTDRRKARANFEKHHHISLQDRFLVVSVAANKGTPSRKNFVGMIEAFSKFARHMPDAFFYIHTDPTGTYGGENIGEIAQAFGVADKVITPGSYDILCSTVSAAHMNDIYNAADVFMLLSRGEGFGIPILEAQAAGCPVIVTDFSACKELCFGGQLVAGSMEMIHPPVQQMKAHTSAAELALMVAYDNRDDDQMRQAARDGALLYDVDEVMTHFMLPALRQIETEIKEEHRQAKSFHIPSKSDPFYRTPDVSVFIPLYNVSEYGEDMVRRAIASVESQRDDVYVELVLVDDASTDNTLDILKQWDYGIRVKVLHRQENGGPMACLNDAAAVVRGRYFIQGSSRAWFEYGALKAMVDALDSNPGIGFVYGATEYHGAEERLHQPPVFRREDFYVGFPSLQAFMYRREAWDKGLRYIADCQFEGKWIYPGDWDFSVQMIETLGWDGMALPDLVYHYFRSEGGQQTDLLKKYHAEVYHAWKLRWPYITPEMSHDDEE